MKPMCSENAANITIHICQVERFSHDQQGWLSQLEKQTLAKRTRSLAQRQFLTSRFMAKSLILGNSQRDWQDYSARYLAEQNTFALSQADTPCAKFSLSHSEGLVALVDVAQYMAAVDIQFHNKSESRWRRIAGTFHSSELGAIQTSADFFRAWVAKEAVAKLTGVSCLETLGIPVNQLEQRYQIDYLNIAPGVSCALARPRVDQRPVSLQHWAIEYPQLVRIA